jgi:intracellular sulfur oxidation DsrE/DsrF family protein
MMHQNTLIQINNFGMGQGESELGIRLLTNYFKLILDEKSLPRFISFYNSGVQLLTADSPVIEPLKELEKQGVKLIACKTCMDYYKIPTPLPVGIAGTMVDIILLQQEAGKVITL